ncbi:unnamed protein product [Calypogeia fissa]
MFLDPMFHLNAKVKDVWNLWKVFVRDLVGAKAWLVYLVKPSPPDPSYLFEFLEVMKHVVLPQNRMTAWDSLLNPRQAKVLRSLVRTAGRGNLLGMWLSDYKKDLVWTDVASGSLQWHSLIAGSDHVQGLLLETI